MIYEEKDDYLMIRKNDLPNVGFIKITETKVYIRSCEYGNVYQYDLKYFYDNIKSFYCFDVKKDQLGNEIKRYLILYFSNSTEKKIESDIDSDIDTLFLMEKINKKIKYFLDKEKRVNCFF